MATPHLQSVAPQLIEAPLLDGGDGRPEGEGEEDLGTAGNYQLVPSSEIVLPLLRGCGRGGEGRRGEGRGGEGRGGEGRGGEGRGGERRVCVYTLIWFTQAVLQSCSQYGNTITCFSVTKTTRHVDIASQSKSVQEQYTYLYDS